MLTKEGIHNLSTEKDTKKRHIIRAVYEDNDILRQEGGKLVIAKPRECFKEMYQVWEEIEGFIKQERTESFKTLIVKLLSPPYGLRLPSIPLILAAVMRNPYLDGCLNIKKGVQFFKAITADLIEDIVKTPHLYQPVYKELTATRKAVLEGVADVFGVKDADVTTIKDTIIRWWQSLPLHCSRHTHKHISPESIALRKEIFDALIKLESNPNEILIEKLAEKLRINFTQTSPSEIKKSILEKLGMIKHEYETCLEKLTTDIEDILQNVFGDIKEWYQDLPEDNKNYRSYQPQQVNKFLNVVSSYVNGKIDTEGLIKELPKAICLPLEDWNDEEIVSFQTKLKDYKEIIEKYRPPIPQPSPSVPIPRLTSDTTALPSEEAEIVFQRGGGVSKKRRFKLRSLEEIKKDPVKKSYVQWFEQSLNNLLEANAYFSEDELYSTIFQILAERI